MAAEKYRLTEEQKQFLISYKRKKRKKKALRLLLILLIIAAVALYSLLHFRKPQNTLPAEDKLSVHFIDVGQGDCTFIAANGSTMLIDCGEYEYSAKVVDYLRGLGVKRLDCIIATHPHSDHMGGMYRITDSFDVGEVIIPHIPDEDIPATRFFEKFLDSCEENDICLTEAVSGRVIDIGSARAEIIAPSGERYDDMNDLSVGIILSFGKTNFLLTGDAGADSEAEMTSSGRLSHVSVYKAAHHGSAYSSTAELLEIVSPDIAVISCGADNSYGHPADSTVKRLRKYTDKIYRTDIHGTIVIESDGNVLSVRTEVNENDNN